MDYSHNNNMKRRKKQRSQLPRVKNKAGLLVFRVIAAAVLIGGFAAVGAGFGIYMGIIKNAPPLMLENIDSGNYTSFIYNSKTGEELERLSGEENRVYASFDRMPQYLKDAFVAIEDERFYSHNGVDFRGMARAVVTIVQTAGNTTQGASTITQQLIKNILDRYDSDLTTKLQEQYLAVQFEKRLAEPHMLGSKEAAKAYILESYMNAINLGRGYYGVQSAAWNYFGKDVSELTISESAVIAAITQNPTRYQPDKPQEMYPADLETRPKDNRYRQELVLEKMLELNFITQAEFDEAWNDNVYDRVIQGARATDGSTVVHSYFTDALIKSVSEDLQKTYSITEIESFNWIYNKGLQIYSTQDDNIQRIVDEVFADPANYPEGDYEIDVVYELTVRNSITEKITNHYETTTVKTMEEVDPFVREMQDEFMTANDDVLGETVTLVEQPQASFTLIDYHTGHVLAIAGGRGEKKGNLLFNRATDATRSPGSQYKVLASYAPAIDLGIATAATVYDDAPYNYNGYTPRNWWGSTYEGLSNVRRGIYRSMNILAVKNLITTGFDKSFAYLRNFGFTTLVDGETRDGRVVSDMVPSLSLGGLTDGVKQVELCAAYGTIANKGRYNKPVFYTKVLDHDGKVLLENIPENRQVIKEAAAYVLTDMMEDTVQIGTGTKAAFQEVSMPVAGKTGTTTDTVDIGFSGYTPYYAASVWMGFDQQKMIRDTAQSHHLMIWRKIMEEVHRDLPEKSFEQPDGIVSATVCRDSGMLITDLCKRDPRGSRAYTEIFVAGTQPTEHCEVHQELLMDTSTNMKAGPYCPGDVVDFKVGIVRPEPADPNASITDRAYEFTPEILEGECTVHGPTSGGSEFYNYGGTPGLSDVYPGLSTPAPEFPWSGDGNAYPVFPPAESAAAQPQPSVSGDATGQLPEGVTSPWPDTGEAYPAPSAEPVEPVPVGEAALSAVEEILGLLQ